MKTFVYPVTMAILVFASAFTLVTSNQWKVNGDNYSVRFTSSKMEGVFKGLKTDIVFDESNLASSSIKASIEAATVNTGNGMRNKHAQQGLGADQYASIAFESIAIIKKGDMFEATGKLTIKDVTKEIKLPFSFKRNQTGGVFEGEFKIKPAEYHVDKSGTPEELDIQLTIPVVQ
ncbi:MAG: YceI family protein [Cytophagaceae bacterium]|jgi:polyisoprenoid-binding protein YceI|nr:YceI family protein [Cytophagaceae bacterium]